jgi:tripartite ATP-independent transporter DctP family solute receptor
MKKPTRHILLIASALVVMQLSGCSAPDDGESAPPAVLKVGQVLPPSHPTSRAMLEFERRVEELTEGRVDVRLYSSGQLGGADQMIMLSQIGNLEACVVSAAPLAQYVETFNVLVMPFVFRDHEHQYTVVDGPVGTELGEHLRGTNLHAAAFFDSGSRNVMTIDGPIRSPEDLRGMKIRVMSSNVLQETVACLGAMPQTISQGEVYSALQTGVIDGWENNPATCLAFSMYETGCNHFAWTRHVAIPDLLVFSRQWYDSLDPDIRQAVNQAAEETKQHQRQLWQQDDKEAILSLETAGMTFNEVDREAFLARFADFYSRSSEKYGPEFERLLIRMRRSGEEAQ